jgi:hypothetical protein
MSDKTHMHDNGESYSVVVPAKQPNKSGQPPAEALNVSAQTIERYLDCKQRIRPAVNDRIGIEPNP